PGARSFVAWLRGEYRFFAVPVVALVEDTAEPAFREALTAGADDAVSMADLAAVGRLVDQVRAHCPDEPTRPAQIKALIVHADPLRRKILGRTFRLGGFDPNFAEDVQEAGDRLRQDPSLRVVVYGAQADEEDLGGAV